MARDPQASVAGACPYLGLEMDPSVMLSVPSAAHCCFAAHPATSLDPEYQARVCLQAAHGQCPRFAVAEKAGRAPAVRYGPPRAAQQTRPPRRPGYWLVAVMGALLFMAVVTAALNVRTRIGKPYALPPATLPTVLSQTPHAIALLTPALATSSPTATPTPSAQPTPATVGVVLPTVTPRGNAQSQAIVLEPAVGQVGWWRSGPNSTTGLGDSFLYAGESADGRYVSAFTLGLDSIPRGAPLLAAELALTGLRADLLAADASDEGSSQWFVQLAAADGNGGLEALSPEEMGTLATSITMPAITRANLAQGAVNRWPLDQEALGWLADLCARGVPAIIVRISMQHLGADDDSSNALFAWDSGQGPKSNGAAPMLTVQIGAVPATPPPLPTSDLLVATTTPTPVNVATVAALQQTATYVAQTVGTYTPMPPFATPTPVAQNVATAQAIARSQGQVAVVLETPVPANVATETALQAEATFVALTTGTYTPVPTAYVTPMLVVPSPPALNVATEVARQEAAGAAADSGVVVPALPFNAVEAQWVEATLTPQNVATAAALSLQATADAERLGQATATPWGRIVYTPVPPLPSPQPTPTPTLPLIENSDEWTPTPTPLPTPTPPAVLPDDMRGRVLFKSNRLGNEETYAFDPATGTTARINADWAWPLAAQQLAVSPDGQSIAIVKPDTNGILQIFVHSTTYGSDTQITNFKQQGTDTASYDPAWSPTGEWIAFVSNNSGNDEIYRVSLDGTVVEQLTMNQWEWDKHPTWSPDGSQIVFFSNRDTQRRQIWIMNADGSDQHALAPSIGDDWDPVWAR